MNGGNAMDFFGKSSFQWSSINTDSLTSKAGEGTCPKVMRVARTETPLKNATATGCRLQMQKGNAAV